MKPSNRRISSTTAITIKTWIALPPLGMPALNELPKAPSNHKISKNTIIIHSIVASYRTRGRGGPGQHPTQGHNVAPARSDHAIHCRRYRVLATSPRFSPPEQRCFNLARHVEVGGGRALLLLYHRSLNLARSLLPYCLRQCLGCHWRNTWLWSDRFHRL